MKDTRGWLLLWRSLGSRTTALWRVASWSAVGSLPTLLSGLLVSRALDRGFLTGHIIVGLGFLGVMALLSCLAAFATQRLYPWCAELVEPARDYLVTAVVAGSLTAERGFSACGGEAVARSVEQVETIRSLLGAFLRSMQRLAMPVVSAIVGLLVLSPVVAAVIMPPVVICLLLYIRVVPTVSARQRQAAIADEQLAEEATRIFKGARDVAALGAQSWAENVIGRAAEASAEATVAAARADILRSLAVTLGADLPLFAVLGAAAVLVPSGRLSVGAAVGAAMYVRAGLAPAVRTLVHTGGSWLIQLGVLSNRIVETAQSPDTRSPLSVGPHKGRIAQRVTLHTKSLTFRYGVNAEDVIHDLDLAVPHGQHLAIVGPSGSGKSTLALLLSGVLSPTQGQVLVGGRDVVDWDEEQLRRTIAVIPQQAYIFAGSVWENLTYLQPDPDRATVERAIELFGLGETVGYLGGLDGLIPADGRELSAGQSQAITLARAWLSPAEVVILDEATSHLDLAAEASAEAALASRGGSLIVIAHRFSSVLRASRILALDGTSAAQGTHTELLATSRAYREMCGLAGPPVDGPEQRHVTERPVRLRLGMS